jgi:hypothetical protein
MEFGGALVFAMLMLAHMAAYFAVRSLNGDGGGTEGGVGSQSCAQHAGIRDEHQSTYRPASA